MKIHVKYFERCSEGCKAPGYWLSQLQDEEFDNIYDEAWTEASEVSNPNDMGDDWDVAFDEAYNRRAKELAKLDEHRRKKIYFQHEDVCDCCQRQLDATYPWERDKYYHDSFYNLYGECEACVVGCCDIIEDHA